MTDAEQGNETTPLVKKKTVQTSDKLSVLPTIMDDVIDTVKLGVPIFISMLSWVGMKTTDTARLGHVSRDALAAAALSDVWTM